jgi:arylsulfatase A-like enzyme
MHPTKLLPLVLMALLAAADLSAQSPTPNLVVIFIDDMAYADIGPFGGKIPTPNLDRMAKEGMRFTDFSAATAVCSASRAALLTGCYHRRVGISGALGPNANHGLHEREMTLAELCKQKDYATACFGKWHLGHHPKFLPTNHGFDEFYGLPYSNDMWPLHPAYAHLPTAAERRKRGYPDLPMIEGVTVVNKSVSGKDQEQLTTQYTERAVRFIEKNKAKPFFCYVPHSMVHVPLFVSDKFKGKSGHGLFGDVVMEIDWSVGQILDAIKRSGVDKNTLVVFTSDNGPWLSYGDHAGSSGQYREGKGTMFEGGIREPTIMRWPGRIPSGTCSEFASTIDIVPTFAKLIGAKLPDHKIDGHDIAPLMFNEEGAQSPHQAFLSYYGGGQLQAIRNARWKLHFPHRYRTMAGKPGGKNGSPTSYSQGKIGLELFDLRNDPSESTDVAAENPGVVAQLQKLANAARKDLGDKLTKVKGNGIRPSGKLNKNDKRLIW